ncbi:2-dehydro-3-deoxyphosphogluconate aldolase [Microbacterium marmarense]|uniref:2-dehydro-3-deoxyphosphogluconate aldolase n=1 Tax=Microbacterium marmarense TaxID=3122051 RepID=A0ABU8LT13_9MICO
MRRYEIAEAIGRSGSVAIVRASSAAKGAEQAATLLEAGQTVLEVSMTTPGALAIITDLQERFSNTGAIIGVGTVLDEVTARLAHLAGAQFVVSPTVDESVLRAAHRYGMATLPGVGTPSEAMRAVEAGADFAKLFPASVYGPASVGDFLSACPQIALIPTGGVTLDNAPDYIRAGAVAVGIGSALTKGDADGLSRRVEDLRVSLERARGDR